ncbi:uncharacterized protein DUF6270 [Micrococcus sp. 140720015-1]
MDVVVYGSCVSRDVFRVDATHQVAAYVARSSWISATTRSIPHPDIPLDLNSAFQRRIVEQDFESAIPSIIRSTAGSVLIDMTYERHGVLEVDGGYITPSNEFLRSSWASAIQGRHIRFGTPEHFTLWSRAAVRLARMLEGRRVWVIRAPFAARTESGAEVKPDKGLTPEEWRGRFSIYYEVLRDLGFPILDVPQNLCLSADDHEWGPAPMHYSDDFYRWVSGQIPRMPRFQASASPRLS